MSSTRSSERETIAADLKKYCGLDTYVMYAIWRHLYQFGKWQDACASFEGGIAAIILMPTTQSTKTEGVSGRVGRGSAS